MLLGFLPLGPTQQQPEEKENRKYEEMAIYGPTSSMAVPVKSDVWVTCSTRGRIRSVTVLQKDMKVVVNTCRNVSSKHSF